MKDDTRSLKESIKTICESMLVIHNSQRATIAWLINVGTKQSAQLSKELRVELASLESFLQKLTDLRDSL
jgi:uncharacterized phage infection (PIP) family protein YhgE